MVIYIRTRLPHASCIVLSCIRSNSTTPANNGMSSREITIRITGDKWGNGKYNKDQAFKTNVH